MTQLSVISTLTQLELVPRTSICGHWSLWVEEKNCAQIETACFVWHFREAFQGLVHHQTDLPSQNLRFEISDLTYNSPTLISVSSATTSRPVTDAHFTLYFGDLVSGERQRRASAARVLVEALEVAMTELPLTHQKNVSVLILLNIY